VARRPNAPESLPRLAGGVFNSGLLAAPRLGSTYDYTPATPDLIERAQRIDHVCMRHDVALRAAAIQFAGAHPAVVSVVIGMRSVAELEENLVLARTPIPAGLWDELKEEGLLRPDAPVPVAANERGDRPD
jgi:D-threo-aldose 1-dehydrogenase